MKFILSIFFIFGTTLSFNILADDNNKTTTISFVGDVMLGSKGRLPPNEGVYVLQEAIPFLKSTDLSIGNLEGTIGNKGQQRKNCNKCYSFQSPPWAARRLKEAGFDLWSMANNHAMDFGISGAQNTLEHLNQQGMAGTGLIGNGKAVAKTIYHKICLLAYAPNTGTNSLHNTLQMQQQVIKAKKDCDIVIVSMHTGAEGIDKTMTPNGNEYYLGENRGNPKKFARLAIDAGADMVMGHGPHVPRGMELYKQKLIAYSLGNFATLGMSTYGALGYAPLLIVEFDETGNFRRGKIISFVQQKNRVLLDPQHRAFFLMKTRSEKDMPSSLRFENQEALQVGRQNQINRK